MFQPNGPLRQNHSWLSTLVSIATEEAPVMESLWHHKKKRKKKRGAKWEHGFVEKYIYSLFIHHFASISLMAN